MLFYISIPTRSWPTGTSWYVNYWFWPVALDGVSKIGRLSYFKLFFSSLPKYRPALLNGHLKSSGGLSDGLIWSSAWLCLLWESVVKVSQRFSTSWLMQSRVHFWFSQADCVMLELQRTTLACAWLGYHGYSFSPPPVSETFGRWTNRPSCKRDSELTFPISWMTKYHLIITM